MRSVRMILGEVVTNLPPSTPGWKALRNRSLDLLAPQPLQLMLKTGLLTLKRYSRFWDVLMNSRLGWQVTSWKEMLSIGGRLLNKPKKVRRMWLPCHGRISVTSSFCSTFPGFVGKKAGPLEEQAKHFKWALCDWILDGIVNTKFTNVAQVANAARNIEILRERSSRNNKETVMGTVFDRQLRIAIRGVMIRRVMTVAVMTSRVATVIKSHGRTKGSSTTILLGLHVRKDTRTMPSLLHVTHVGNFIRARHVTGLLELVSLMVRLGIWPGIAQKMVETVVEEMGTTTNLLLRGKYFL
ncbi:hypothetical protein Tco_1484932 [Tanacetum coccineum]